MRPTAFTHAFGFALAALLAWALSAGCGRSGLDDYATSDGGADAQPDAPATCSPATCPSGCCDTTGKCRAGIDLLACGGGGQACENCQADGFDQCDTTLHACETKQPMCNTATCPTGCCTTVGGTPACISGVSSVACGLGGQACVDCTQSGQVCDLNSHSCQTVTCDATTCAGCCQGNVCQPGTTDGACGLGGIACTTCPSTASCNPSSGKCNLPPPKCNASTCPSGCCSGDICITPGTTDTACGTPGGACVDCTKLGEACMGGKCAPSMGTCNAMSCVGCCQAGTCFAGFLDSRCGSGGVSCADCTGSGETCDTSATPRVCTSMTTCPSPYSSCSAPATPVEMVTSGACAASDLNDAESACKSGFGSSACQTYFTTIASINPKCATCLQPFEYSFNDLTGIFNCVSPYVDSTCNGETACATDCVTQSCSSCDPASVPGCITSVRGMGGQCQTYVQQAGICVAPVLFGPFATAKFCSPTGYSSYGAWLKAVGQNYCGP